MQATLCAIDWDKLVRVLSALLTPTIAGIAVYIARQQWKTAHQQAETNKRQARLALYDKRMTVFNDTVKLIAAVVSNAAVELDELKTFLRDTREHEFLFGPDIALFLDELWKKGTELRAHGNLGRQFDRQTELIMWFNEQLKEARTKFKPYMSFPEP